VCYNFRQLKATNAIASVLSFFKRTGPHCTSEGGVSVACGRGDRWQGYGSNSKPPKQHVFRDGELLHRSSSGERGCVSCAAKSVASLHSCQAGHGKWAAHSQLQAMEHELMDKPDPRRKPARSSCYSSPITHRHQGSLVSSSVWTQQEQQGCRPRLRPIPTTAGSSCVLLLPDRRWMCHLREPWAPGTTELRSRGETGWQGKRTVVRTTTDGEEQQAAIGSEIASDWVGAARAGRRCLLAHSQ